MMQMAMSAVRPITIALVLALACAVRVQAQRLEPVSYPLRAARSHTSEDVSAAVFCPRPMDRGIVRRQSLGRFGYRVRFKRNARSVPGESHQLDIFPRPPTPNSLKSQLTPNA